MKYPGKWERQSWSPKKIIYEATEDRLTAGAGLGPLVGGATFLGIAISKCRGCATGVLLVKTLKKSFVFRIHKIACPRLKIILSIYKPSNDRLA